MKQWKQVVKEMPVVEMLRKARRERALRNELVEKSTKEIFTDIYEDNFWGGLDSVSGKGSDSDQTRILVKELRSLLDEFEITTILDIPCGDFHWMKNVDLNGISYLGADIVTELKELNSCKYGSDSLRFQTLNLLEDQLPEVDLVFCRDCLVHFSFQDIFSALNNIVKSQARYVLTTTFPDRKVNHKIATGQWRPLNLELPPFNFPPPLTVLVEGCTQGDGINHDKSLGLWKVSNIQTTLESNRNSAKSKRIGKDV